MKRLLRSLACCAAFFFASAASSTANTTNAIAFGEIASGSITNLTQTNYYTFTASSNDVIYLAVLRTNGLGSPIFYLEEPDGFRRSASMSSDFAELANLRLTKTGNYTVAVFSLNQPYAYLATLTTAACGVNQRETMTDDPETIIPGQIAKGHLSGADLDTFCFTASSNDVIYLALLRTNGGTFPAFYLYDPDGIATLANGHPEFSELPNYRLAKTGTYTIGILDNGLNESFDYLLTLTKAACGVNQRETTTDDPETITPGQIAKGQISPLDLDTYCFTANSNDVIYLALLRTNGGTFPAFYLYDPDGIATLANSHPEFSELPNYRLSKTGQYTITVLDNGLNESFDYLLSLTKAACGVNQRESTTDNPETIALGQIAKGQISPADLDTYCFTASSNDVIYLAVLRTNGGTFPAFFLYDPDGAAVVSTGTADFAELANYRLNTTGQYTVAVLDNGLNESFDYLLSLTKAACGVNQREAGDGAETIVPGHITSGQISPLDFDTFCFTASSNDVIYLAVLRTNGADSPVFFLYDPDGAAVVSTGTADFAELANRRLTKSGTYTVAVLHGTLKESFGYNLCMIRNPGPSFPDPGDGSYIISPYEPVTAQITPGDLDAYAFHGIAGDTLTIDVQKISGDGLNPAVFVLAPDGTVLASASSPTSARVRVSCVSQTGIYVLFLLDNGLNEAFGYSLSLSQTPIVPPSSGTNQYLAAYLCASNVFLRWETNAVGFRLESTPALPSTNWSPVDQVPYVIAHHYYVADGVTTNASKFYRLRCTNCVPGSFLP